MTFAAMPSGEFSMSGGEMVLIAVGLLLTIIVIAVVLMALVPEIRREKRQAEAEQRAAADAAPAPSLPEAGGESPDDATGFQAGDSSDLADSPGRSSHE